MRRREHCSPDGDTGENPRLPAAPAPRSSGKGARVCARETQKGLRALRACPVTPEGHPDATRSLSAGLSWAQPFPAAHSASCRPPPPRPARRAESGPAPPYPVLQLGRELALELASRPAAVVALDEHLARHGRLLRPHRAAATRGHCRRPHLSAPPGAAAHLRLSQKGRDDSGLRKGRKCQPAHAPPSLRPAGSSSAQARLRAAEQQGLLMRAHRRASHWLRGDSPLPSRARLPHLRGTARVTLSPLPEHMVQP